VGGEVAALIFGAGRVKTNFFWPHEKKFVHVVSIFLSMV
jgi:hypothetical protein